MNISIITYNAEVGGAGIATKRLYEALSSLGVDCTLYDQCRTYKSGNVSYHPFRRIVSKIVHKIDSSVLKLFPARLSLPWNIGVVSLPLVFYGRGILNSDLVICAWQPGLSAPKNIRKHTRRLILIMHDAWWFTAGCHVPLNCNSFKNNCSGCEQLRGGRLADTILRFLYRKKIESLKFADNILSPSIHLSEMLKSCAIDFADKVKVLPNIPNNDDFYFDGFRNINKNIILIIGGANFSDPAKGLVDLELLIRKIVQDVENLTLRVVGGGCDIEIPGLEVHNIEYISSSKKMGHLYRDATLVLHLSRFENLSNTLIEASLCGTPALCWDVGGNSEIVSRENMFIYGDFQMLALRSIEILRKADNNSFKDYRKALAAEAKEKFNSDDIANRYIKLLFDEI